MTIDECLRLVVMRKVINGIGEEEKIALKLFKFIKKIYNNYNFCIYQRSPAELESIGFFLNNLIRIRVMSKIIFFNRACTSKAMRLIMG